MSLSIFIARIFGICYLVIGAGLLLNRKFFREVMEDFCKNKALLLLGGMAALVVGVVIVLSHNVWVANWTVLITIIGWIGLIKGIWILVFPNTVEGFIQGYLKNENLLVVHSISALVFGAVLAYFGFFT